MPGTMRHTRQDEQMVYPATTLMSLCNIELSQETGNVLRGIVLEATTWQRILASHPHSDGQ